jgi:urate oxidase
MPLGPTSWGKSEIRLAKVHRGEAADDFSDITAHIQLEGDVAAAHTDGDNTGVLPTDTMRNTVYALAHQLLDSDLEDFGDLLCHRFLANPGVSRAEVTLWMRTWARESPHGFVGGSSERRLARVIRGSEESTTAGIEGLVLLKTTGSSFVGFPRDEYTTLPETEDRVLATSVAAEWVYSRVPTDTPAIWGLVRRTLIDHFFDEWSASVQHQGYMMGEAVLAAVGDIEEISLRLPNQHHLSFDVARFGVEDIGVVFHPVSEPYGDIRLTVTR